MIRYLLVNVKAPNFYTLTFLFAGYNNKKTVTQYFGYTLCHCLAIEC